MTTLTTEPRLPLLLRLPPEIRELILYPSLSTTYNHATLPARPQEERAFISTLHLLTKNRSLLSYLRRTVWLGNTPETTTTTTCSLDPALLRACRRLHQEGGQIIYKQNQYVGIIVDRDNYGTSLRRAGIKKHWGPLPLPELSFKTVSNPSDRRPSPAVTFKFERASSADDQLAEHWIYLCCMEDRDRVLSSLNDAFEIADASQSRNKSLRIWISTMDDELHEWVLEHVLPLTRVYTTSVTCGASISASFLATKRAEKMKKALELPESRTRFQIYYEDVMSWLEKTEKTACVDFAAGRASEAERLFDLIDERTESLVSQGSLRRIGDQFACTRDLNTTLLSSSVALYHLLHIRSPQTVNLQPAVLAGVLALRLPSPVPQDEWRSRICAKLSCVFYDMADLQRGSEYQTMALDALRDRFQTVYGVGTLDKTLHEECGKAVEKFCAGIAPYAVTDKVKAQLEQMPELGGKVYGTVSQGILDRMVTPLWGREMQRRAEGGCQNCGYWNEV